MIHSKINCHTKNQEKHKLNEKRPSTYINTKMNWILDLVYNDFKDVVIKHFQKQLQLIMKEVREKQKISAKKQILLVVKYVLLYRITSFSFIVSFDP